MAVTPGLKAAAGIKKGDSMTVQRKLWADWKGLDGEEKAKKTMEAKEMAGGGNEKAANVMRSEKADRMQAIEKTYGKEFAQKYASDIDTGAKGLLARRRQKKVDEMFLPKKKQVVVKPLKTPKSLERTYGISKLQAALSNAELMQIAKDLESKAKQLSKNSNKEMSNGRRNTSIATRTFAAGKFRAQATDIRSYLSQRDPK